SSNVLNSSIFKLSFFAEALGSIFNESSSLELTRLVNQIIGLNKSTNFSNNHDDFSANFSGYTEAIVFGVISENIKMTIVKMIEPTSTLPPKKLSINIVTIAEARIFAKLFPTRIADNRISGLLRSLIALVAPLDPFARFLSFTLFEAIMPVSEPDEKAENTNKEIKIVINKNRESSNIN
ncbi:MAG: hypothetical protein RI886_1253, partial [Pseudomonadota bacterium]